MPLAALALMFGFASCEVEPAYELGSASLMYSIEIDMAVEQKAKIYVDQTESPTLPLLVGESVQLGFNSDPADLSTLTHPEIAWTSSNEDVVVVEETGKITAKSPGVAVVTVSPATINIPATSSLKVTVVAEVVKATAIEITSDSEHESEFAPGLPSCYIGETMTLKAKVTPAEATYQTVLWSSANEEIAVIDPITGLVTGVSQGEVVMTAQALDADKVTKTMTIYVDKIIVPEGIKITNAPAAGDVFSVADGHYQMTFETYPAVSTKSKITWTTSDPAVATVDTQGKVTFLKYGTVDITATVPETEAEHDGFVKTQTMRFNIPAGFYREHFADQNNISWAIQSGGTQEWRVGKFENYLYCIPGVQGDASKLRGDLKRSVPFYISGDYPILTIRIDDINDQEDFTNANYKLDLTGNMVSDGTKYTFPDGNRAYLKDKSLMCSDGSSIFVYDLSTQTPKAGSVLKPGDIVESTVFQVKIADIKRKDGANHTADHRGYYRFFWVHTFKSEAEMNQYLNDWSNETGITFDIKQ